MFGGLGFYWGETIFRIQFRDRLYFKVNNQSRGEYLAKGLEPFRPNERQTLKLYYEVPPDVLADPEALRSWVR
jgi:TfoX/Sxy family transcriptional regulator of competence genes